MMALLGNVSHHNESCFIKKHFSFPFVVGKQLSIFCASQMHQTKCIAALLPHYLPGIREAHSKLQIFFLKYMRIIYL